MSGIKFSGGRKQERVKSLEEIVNTSPESLKDVGTFFADATHPTLQQNFMRVVVEFIQASSKHLGDGRNNKTIDLCKKLNEVLKQEGTDLPFR